MTKRNKDRKHLGLEIDNDLHYKLFYIAEYEGRTGSGQVIYLLRKYIKAFEEENGEIPLPDDLQNFKVHPPKD